MYSSMCKIVCKPLSQTRKYNIFLRKHISHIFVAAFIKRLFYHQKNASIIVKMHLPIYDNRIRLPIYYRLNIRMNNSSIVKQIFGVKLFIKELFLYFTILESSGHVILQCTINIYRGKIISNTSSYISTLPFYLKPL